MIKYEEGDLFLSTKPEDTEAGWQFILDLCRKQKHIGFSQLDSFLCGPDIDRRVKLVVDEAEVNEWLRLELRDALSLNQTKDIPKELIAALRSAVGNSSNVK